MPKVVLAPIPFRGGDTTVPSPPPPPPPPSTFHCKLRADLACIGARNAALYSRCALRLDALQRCGMPEFPILHPLHTPAAEPPPLRRVASAPDLFSGHVGMQATRSW